MAADRAPGLRGINARPRAGAHGPGALLGSEILEVLTRPTIPVVVWR